ncbi:MAG: hypothetical protein ACFCVG_03380, partial [Kineosporiaceae bacterium]
MGGGGADVLGGAGAGVVVVDGVIVVRLPDGTPEPLVAGAAIGVCTGVRSSATGTREPPPTAAAARAAPIPSVPAAAAP